MTVGALALLAYLGSERSTVQGRPFLRDTPRTSIQDAERVPRKKPIPKGYKTYSLFLVCNPRWLAPEKREGLLHLYQQFDSFGRTIGDQNVAVWFLASQDSRNDQELADNVDVERSVRFCQAWKLKPSAGPHVVITATYPNEMDLSSGLPKDSAVFELGNMGPKEISDLFAKLTDELIEKGRVDNSANAAKEPEAFWVRLLEAAQHSINSFGCAWSFKIEAGAVSANLRSCQGH